MSNFHVTAASAVLQPEDNTARAPTGAIPEPTTKTHVQSDFGVALIHDKKAKKEADKEAKAEAKAQAKKEADQKKAAKAQAKADAKAHKDAEKEAKAAKRKSVKLEPKVDQ
ncbi:hypothetical protein A4X03_0g7993, partial [Tilletia caries]